VGKKDDGKEGGKKEKKRSAAGSFDLILSPVGV